MSPHPANRPRLLLIVALSMLIAPAAHARPVDESPVARRATRDRRTVDDSARRERSSRAIRASADVSDFDADEHLERILAVVDRSAVPSLVGADHWDDVVDRFSPAAERAGSHFAFADAVNRMFKASGISHFAYFTDEDFGYWYLRSALGGGDRPAVSHAGLFPQRIDGRWFVRGILEGSPAAGLGISVGDEIVAFDGRPFLPVSSFRDHAGKPGRLTLRHSPADEYGVTVTPVRESLDHAVRQAMLSSIAVIEVDGRRFAYLHGWSLLSGGQEYRELLKMQDRVDGLLLDYRDGVGGRWETASRFLFGFDVLHPPVSERTVGDRSDRRGRAVDASRRWTLPLVMLTDDGTRSAKEIVARAVKNRARGLLVGTATPGHVTAVGGLARIGADGLLMLPGMRFKQEGHPVEPDILVSRDLRYCGGRDPQMIAGVQALLGLIDRKGAR